MALGLQPAEWAPVLVTIALLFLVVFVTDAVASRTWADLIGLFYLMASPFLYRYLRSTLPESLPSVETVVRRVSPG